MGRSDNTFSSRRFFTAVRVKGEDICCSTQAVNEACFHTSKHDRNIDLYQTQRHTLRVLHVFLCNFLINPSLQPPGLFWLLVLTLGLKAKCKVKEEACRNILRDKWCTILELSEAQGEIICVFYAEICSFNLRARCDCRQVSFLPFRLETGAIVLFQGYNFPFGPL